MWRYITRRLFMTVLVVILAAIVIFTIVFLVPGDPARIILGSESDEASLQEMREILGLDKPYLIQLGTFLYNAFIKLDFGDSWLRGTDVFEGMMTRLPYTMLLGFLSICLSTAVGIPLGITAATHFNGWQDHACMVLGMVFISLPEFWFALMLVILFSLKLGWLPSFGIESWACWILPVLASSVRSIGTLARQTRSSMLEVIRSDFITTARAKGLAEKKVVLKHMLPNALIPVITIVGGSFGRCVAGSVIIEQIFSLPGVGTYLIGGVQSRDYPIVRGCVIILAAFTAILMLLVDLAYAAVDPRIKAQYIDQSKKKRRNTNVE